MRINLQANEVVIKATDTTHSSGKSETKGKLIMTNQRLYFKSVESVDEPANFELLPGEIREIAFYNVFRFIPRGLDLMTSDGRTLRFSLKNRDEWCRQIARMG